MVIMGSTLGHPILEKTLAWATGATITFFAVDALATSREHKSTLPFQAKLLGGAVLGVAVYALFGENGVISLEYPPIG